MTNHFELPPLTRKEDGSERRVGVEIEFAGPSLQESVALVQQVFGGTIENIDAYRSGISNTCLGDFEVELDTTFAHAEERSGLVAQISAELAGRIGDVAKYFVPFEIVSPPIPITRLQELETLIAKLAGAGAAGTNARLYYAFGVHLNPELASLEIGFVLRQFQAFLLLEDWLNQHANKSITRKLVGFAEPFSRDFADKVLQLDYEPDWSAFIDDYIDANPTRNRSLDLLPLLAFVDEARVSGRVQDERVKRRPTFHYRLPDSRLDEKEWSLARVWNRWVEVERLADDESRFANLRQRFLASDQ